MISSNNSYFVVVPMLCLQLFLHLIFSHLPLRFLMQLDGGVYSLAMLAALNCGMYQQVPRIAARARSEDVPLTEASYTILIKVI